MSRPPLRVALLGAGTVGRAVIDGLVHHRDRLASAAGRPVDLAGVAVRDVDRAVGGGIAPDLVTDAPAHLVASPETDVIVELIGGDEPARTLIAASLGAGKPVVTANKHVVAHHGPELEAIARRSETPFRFEAAVGGGIPVLGPLSADLAGNAITRVRGIVNGTTNHILTAMALDGLSYDVVLADAQARGYAEADPSGDVEGDDAVNKLVILARLAFGAWLDPDTVGRRPPTACGDGRPGITGVTDAELRGARAAGLMIKLLASARRRDDGTIEAAVLPTAVPLGSAFGRTDGVQNRVEIDADPLGTVGFSGPGAGGPATSSAVLGDLVAIARGGGSTWAGLSPAVGPSMRAGDPLDAPRRWFAVLPGPAPVWTEGAGHDPGITIVDGVAVLLTDLRSLADVRADLVRRLPAGLDVTLYPVDA